MKWIRALRAVDLENFPWGSWLSSMTILAVACGLVMVAHQVWTAYRRRQAHGHLDLLLDAQGQFDPRARAAAHTSLGSRQQGAPASDGPVRRPMTEHEKALWSALTSRGCQAVRATIRDRIAVFLRRGHSLPPRLFALLEREARARLQLARSKGEFRFEGEIGTELVELTVWWSYLEATTGRAPDGRRAQGTT